MKLPQDLYIIGLTGGSGAGKGLVAARLAHHGIPTLDTDLVSLKVTEVGKPCLDALALHFGKAFLLPDGSLDRRRLATHVFSAPDADGDENVKRERLDALNRITHKYILEACEGWAQAQYDAGQRTVCMDAPQLFESGLDADCRYTRAVSAKRETRLQRIMVRDGISREAAEARISAQHDDAFWHAHCTAVLQNDGEIEALFAAVDGFLISHHLI